MDLVAIPPGRFLMGAAHCEIGRSSWEGPQREVELGGFEIGRCPVTNAEYADYLAKNPDTPRPQYWNDPAWSAPDLPVVGVGWEEAREFAEWCGCRLPSESEWEYAARSGSTHHYVLGASELDLDRIAWYRANSDGSIHPVARKEPNLWGLHDMLGNVWEWVEDDVYSSHAGAPNHGGPRVAAPRGSGRMVRGGAFYDDARIVRAAARDWRPADSRRDDVGFRIARG